MAKKMSASKIAMDNIARANKFREKYPDAQILSDRHEDMRNDLGDLIKGSVKYTRAQVAAKVGITENLLFDKMNHPHRWKKDEVDKIIKLLLVEK